MKLAPASLVGQLAVLLLLGFLVGSLVGIVPLLAERGTLHPIAEEHALSRTLTAYKLVTEYGAQSEEWLPSFNNALARLWVDDVATPSHAGDHSEKLLATALQQRLHAKQVGVRMPCRSGAEHLPPGTYSSAGDELECVEIDLGLPDGRWLHTRQWLPVRTLWREGWYLLRFSLVAAVFPILILIWVFVARIVRSTRALQHAAESFSRGEQTPRLAEQGPDEIRGITASFNDMRERITRFVDDRTRMLAAISHDLRTPLTSLQLQAAMLPDGNERTEMLRTLEELRQMINATLHFASQQADTEPDRDIDLMELLGEAVQAQVALGHDVVLRGPRRLQYRCRPLQIKRAVANLVGNAVRYGRHVWVSVSEDAGSGHLCIDIEDDGPGLDDDVLERVFEPFFRMDEARNVEHGGNVGLGLAIARSSVTGHGGTLHLHNRECGGLCARIELPKAGARLPAALP